MLVVDLSCPHGHRFEGWFASADDLAGQQARGLVTCPVCGDAQVQRLPSAPRLNVSHLSAEGRVPPSHPSDPVEGEPHAARGGAAPGQAAGQPAALEPRQALEALQAMYWSAVRQVMQHTEDVGERFASEARAMHHGEVAAKPIRGKLDDEEREALKDEGIEVMTLVVPKGMDGPVQ